MPCYRLTVEYEGTRYRGWQEQKNARTVAGELRRAIEAATGERVELGGSGRTDAGVHALAQVAHLRTQRPIAPGDLAAKLEEGLPADIEVLAIEPAPERFHARHAAVSRSYVYQVARRRTALAKRFVWWVRRPLAVDAMRAAAATVVGRHDFATFCEKPDEQTSTIVVVTRCEVAEDGDLVLVRVEASHFLWKMVRRLVGALVAVGTGELDVEGFTALVEPTAVAPRLHVFDPAAHTAPPSGLFLERVAYAGEAPAGALVAPVPVRSAPAVPAAPATPLAPMAPMPPMAPKAPMARRDAPPSRPPAGGRRPPGSPRPAAPRHDGARRGPHGAGSRPPRTKKP